MEDRDIIIPIVIGGLILLGLGRGREEAVPPPPPEEKPPIPEPPIPQPPILATPEEAVPPTPEEIVAPPEIPYPIEFLLPPRREVMPMAVAPPPPPPEVTPEVLPVPPEAIQLPQAPPIAVRLVREEQFMKSYEIILDEGDVVLNAYPLGTENVVISISNIYTGEFKLRSFRAPEGYVVVSWSSSGDRTFIHVGVKRLYAVPWVYPPRPRYLVDYAIATGTGEVFIVGDRE